MDASWLSVHFWTAKDRTHPRQEGLVGGTQRPDAPFRAGRGAASPSDRTESVAEVKKFDASWGITML